MLQEGLGLGLPAELNLFVLSFLGAKDRLTVRQVNSYFKDLSDDDGAWRDLYLKEWYHHQLQDPEDSFYSASSSPSSLLRLSTSSCSSSCSSSSSSRNNKDPVEFMTIMKHGYDFPPSNQNPKSEKTSDETSTTTTTTTTTKEREGEEEGEERRGGRRRASNSKNDNKALYKRFECLWRRPRSQLPPISHVATSWKELFMLRKRIEKGYLFRTSDKSPADDSQEDAAAATAQNEEEEDAINEGEDNGDDDDDDEEAGKTEAALPQVPVEERTYNTYALWGDRLKEKFPKNEDDPVLLEELDNTREMTALQLICSEEYHSALSFEVTNPTELFMLIIKRASVLHEFALYQKHYEGTAATLRVCFETAALHYAAAYQIALEYAPREKSVTLCTWAVLLRDYANSGLHEAAMADELFELSYTKYEASLACCSSHLTHSLTENWAYALREHANAKIQQHCYEEANKLFDTCFEKYAICVSLLQDSVILSNWADALREKAEIQNKDVQERLFAEAYSKYLASYNLDNCDNLTLCNWAMLLVLQARKTLDNANVPIPSILPPSFLLSNNINNNHNKKEKKKLMLAMKKKQKEKDKKEAAVVGAKVVQQQRKAEKAAVKKHAALLEEARAKLKHCVAQQDVWSYFCMARVAAVANDEEECKMWLQKCQHKRYLSKVKQSQLADFVAFSRKPWFHAMLQEQALPNRSTQ
ncbi:F-box domain containing protein [Balamuthia mandrillaris]